MRKMLSLLLTLCMLFSLCTAFAAEITEEGNQSANMTVVYGVDSYYTIVIPDSVTINPETKTGTAKLSISSVVLPSGAVLVIELNSENAHDDKWYLTSGSQEYEYTITSTWINQILPGDYFYCEAGILADKTLTDTCTFTLVDDVPYAGVFTDLITYTISIVTVKEEYQCYVCDKYFTWDCAECASYTQCTHVCAVCPTCADCLVSDKNPNGEYYHCSYCNECLFIYDEHVYCNTCQQCVNPPDFCYECQQCHWCCTEH